MLVDTVFYVLLILQCLLVAWYLPSLLYQRMRRVITQYPPSDYPLLYPKPQEQYHRFHQKFKLAYLSLFCFSLVVVVTVIFEGVNLREGIWSMLPWGLFMVQMVPTVFIEVSEFSHARLLRENNPRSVRVAGLQNRSLPGLLPAWLLIVWVLIQLLCFSAIGWADNFQFTPGNSAFMSVAIILLANIAGIFYLKRLVSGKSLDPHQDPEDKYRASQAVARSMLYVSIGVSLFSAVMRLINHFDAQYLEPLLMCIYCQLIALVSVPTMLKATNPEKLNFEVYRRA